MLLYLLKVYGLNIKYIFMQHNFILFQFFCFENLQGISFYMLSLAHKYFKDKFVFVVYNIVFGKGKRPEKKEIFLFILYFDKLLVNTFSKKYPLFFAILYNSVFFYS